MLALKATHGALHPGALLDTSIKEGNPSISPWAKVRHQLRTTNTEEIAIHFDETLVKVLAVGGIASDKFMPKPVEI